MVSIYDPLKVADIIRRVSNKNYFSPLQPKHALKPRIQRYSKIYSSTLYLLQLANPQCQ